MHKNVQKKKNHLYKYVHKELEPQMTKMSKRRVIQQKGPY